MNRSKRLVNLAINKNSEELLSTNANKENENNNKNFDTEPMSLIILNEDSCHIEEINYDELLNLHNDDNLNLIQPEDLFSNSIAQDMVYGVQNSLDACNAMTIGANALTETAKDFTADDPFHAKANNAFTVPITTISHTIHFPSATDNAFTEQNNDLCTETIAPTESDNASYASKDPSIEPGNNSNATTSVPSGRGDTDIAIPGTSNAALEVETPVTNLEQTVACSDPNNHNMNEGRKRCKTAEPKNWKRNLNKRLRMEGKSYTGFRTDETKKIHQDTPRQKREMKPTCTKNTCIRSKTKQCSKFSDEQRAAIFDKFWSLNWDERKAFICGHVTKIEKQKNTVVGRDSRRNFTLKYWLNTGRYEENLGVCREMFINTLGIGYRMVQLWVKQSSFEMPGPATSRSSDRTNRNAKVDKLRQFLTLLPKMPSHYGRQNSSKLYLEPVFQTIQDVYQLYCGKCRDEEHEPLSRRKFSEVMECDNISLFQLKKDQCNICKSHEAKNITDEKWNEHIKRKELARKHKEQDKEKALAGLQIAIEVDFQAVKLAPFTNANAFYYKTKLACHNYSIYNLQNKQATCYWFSEDQNNQLVASTFVSCLVNYLEKYCLTPEKKDVVVYSDGCTAQNRNNIMSNALLNFSMLHGVKIYQKYLEVGHTQMEVDSVHGCIERKLKGREIKLPSDYVNATKEARRNPCPYEALELEYSFFKDYTQPLRYKSIRPGRNKNDPTVMDIKIIAYSPDGLIKVKLDFDGDYLMLPHRPIRFEPIQMYPSLNGERCKINKSKWLHLQELKSVIPRDCHQFYDDLPYKE